MRTRVCVCVFVCATHRSLASGNVKAGVVLYNVDFRPALILPFVNHTVENPFLSHFLRKHLQSGGPACQCVPCAHVMSSITAVLSLSVLSQPIITKAPQEQNH
jgi:hypothetical protein